MDTGSWWCLLAMINTKMHGILVFLLKYVNLND